MAKSGIIHEAKAVLLDLKRMRGRMARQLDGLRAYDGWVLCKEGKKQTGHDYYDVIRPGAKRKTYLVSDRNEDVLNVKRLRYALKAVDVLDSNILLLSGIPFVYESPLLVDGKNILPDFTILSLIDLKSVIIIEHQGMVFVEEYADKFIRTLKTYLKTDWIPNETLFFTFDDARETLDPRQVISILRQHIKPSIQMPDFTHMAQS